MVKSPQPLGHQSASIVCEDLSVIDETVTYCDMLNSAETNIGAIKGEIVVEMALFTPPPFYRIREAEIFLSAC